MVKGVRSLWVGLMVVGFVLFLALAEVFSAELRLGVLAKRGPAVARKKWGPLTQYLSEKTGYQVKLVPLSFRAIEPAVRTAKIDYLLANPAFYVRLEKKYQLKAIASLLNSRQGRALDRFGGVIFVRKDSPIRELSDLRGKKFMVVKLSSFGGAYMAFRLLLENGINPFRDLQVLEGGTHDRVVLSVQKGLVPAGTVRSDTLERMEAEGKIRVSDFRVLHQVKDDFPFLHSTRLYPEWPFAALKHVPAEVNARVKQALLELKADHPAARAARIAGWVEPLDYTPVAECLRIVDEARKSVKGGR